jgi:spore germination protein
MKYDNERISDISLFFLLSAAITEVGVLEMPRLFAESVGRDLWLVPLLMIPVLWLSLYLFCLLGKRFPDETVFEYAPRLLGRPLAQVLFVVLIAYWFLVTGRMMRDFADVVRLTMLSVTPAEVIIGSMLIASTYLVRKGLEPISRAATVIILITVPIGLSITMLSYVRTSPVMNMRPVLAHGPWKVLREGVRGVGLVEQLSAFLLCFPFLTKPDKAWRTSAVSVALTIILFANVTLSTLAVFGSVDLVNIRLPALSAVKTIEQPFIFIESLSSFYVATWIAQMFITIAFMLWLIATGMQRWLGRRDHVGLAAPALPIIYLIALSPANVAGLDKFIRWQESFGVFIHLPLPLILLILTRLRRVPEKNKQQGREDDAQ